MKPSKECNPMDYKYILLVALLLALAPRAAAQPSRHPGHGAGSSKAARSPSKARVKGTPLTLGRRKAPPALITAQYLDVSVELNRSKLSVKQVLKKTFAKGRTAIPRFTGRYQVRVFSRGLLLDVVRFNFPLTGAAGDPSPLNRSLGRGLARGVKARSVVRVPYDGRITRLVVKDGRSGKGVIVELSPGPVTAVPGAARKLRFRMFGATGQGGNKVGPPASRRP